MSYSDLIQKLFNVNLFRGVKLGLQNARRLQQLLHFPDKTFKTIHVAGTNGKGSVTTKISSALEHAGYRVGLYTSPHISSFRERIRINGKMISEESVESILSFLFELTEAEHIPATFFEYATLLAFLYFAKEKVDVAVLETGLGGRLDATNIVHPCLSIITSISLDHMEILGETREAIALEKGGIIKEKIPVIIGPQVPLEVIKELAHQKGSACFQVNCPSPFFEEENRQIAYMALSHLSSSFYLPQQAIELGLKAKQPCRFEIMAGSLPIILDVAHNPDGLQHLFQTLSYTYPSKPVRILFGISKSKDIQLCLKLIAAHGFFFHLVEATNGRGVPARELSAHLLDMAVDPSIIAVHDSISTGVNFAKTEAAKNQEILLICGSFFIMHEARRALGIQEPWDEIDLNEKYLLEKGALQSF